MGGMLLVGMLAVGVLPAQAAPTLLSQRAQEWPQWSLPAPLKPPGRRDLTYPAWFAGTWQVHSDAPDYTVRFEANASGAIVGDRAFNAQAIGTALLGPQLQGVDNDPANPNRQLARLMQNHPTVTPHPMHPDQTRFQLTSIRGKLKQTGTLTHRHTRRMFTQQQRRTHPTLLTHFMNHQLLQRQHRR
mgnify:CR=1 FL=1